MWRAWYRNTFKFGGGFIADDLYTEVRSTAAYAELSAENWQWALNFVRQGGASLAAYPDYQRAAPDSEGIWRVPDTRLARRHRMNIGTIVSNASMAGSTPLTRRLAGGERPAQCACARRP